MTCKEAIEALKQLLKVDYLADRTREALKMAITALELQDGNLYVRDVPGSLSIGRVEGNVYMGGYDGDLH